MTRYSDQPRDRIFVKGYGLVFFDQAKQSATDALKTISKRAIQKQQKLLVIDLIGNKIYDKITKALQVLPQTNSETVTNEHDKEIREKRCISQEKIQKSIDYLRLI